MTSQLRDHHYIMVALQDVQIAEKAIILGFGYRILPCVYFTLKSYKYNFSLPRMNHPGRTLCYQVTQGVTDYEETKSTVK